MTDVPTRVTIVNHFLRIPAKVTTAVLVLSIVVGLIVGGVVGWILLGFAVLVLTGILGLLWPSIPPTERMLRLSVLLLVLAVSLVRLL